MKINAINTSYRATKLHKNSKNSVSSKNAPSVNNSNNAQATLDYLNSKAMLNFLGNKYIMIDSQEHGDMMEQVLKSLNNNAELEKITLPDYDGDIFGYLDLLMEKLNKVYEKVSDEANEKRRFPYKVDYYVTIPIQLASKVKPFNPSGSNTDDSVMNYDSVENEELDLKLEKLSKMLNSISEYARVYVPASQLDENVVRELARSVDVEKYLDFYIRSGEDEESIGRRIIDQYSYNKGNYNLNILSAKNASVERERTGKYDVVGIKSPHGLESFPLSGYDENITRQAPGVFALKPIRYNGEVKGYNLSNGTEIQIPANKIKKTDEMKYHEKFVGLNADTIINTNQKDALALRKLIEEDQLFDEDKMSKIPDKLYRYVDLFPQEVEQHPNVDFSELLMDKRLHYIYRINNKNQVYYPSYDYKCDGTPSIAPMWGCDFSVMSAAASDGKNREKCKAENRHYNLEGYNDFHRNMQRKNYSAIFGEGNCYSKVEREANLDIEIADDYYRNGDYEKARKFYEKAEKYIKEQLEYSGYTYSDYFHVLTGIMDTNIRNKSFDVAYEAAIKAINYHCSEFINLANYVAERGQTEKSAFEEIKEYMYKNSDLMSQRYEEYKKAREEYDKLGLIQKMHTKKPRIWSEYKTYYTGGTETVYDEFGEYQVDTGEVSEHTIYREGYLGYRASTLKQCFDTISLLKSELGSVAELCRFVSDYEKNVLNNEIKAEAYDTMRKFITAENLFTIDKISYANSPSQEAREAYKHDSEMLKRSGNLKYNLARRRAAGIDIINDQFYLQRYTDAEKESNLKEQNDE